MADYTLKILIDAKDKASPKIGGLKDALGSLTDAARGLAIAGAGLAGLAGLAAGMTSSIKAAMDAQKVQAQLNAVLESTGGVAGVTADAVNSLASEIQRLTPFEDDAVVGAQNILLTFTKIGKDVFPQATWVVADMAQALGMDLKSAAIMVGKALNDPVQGVGALRRVGVSLTEEQAELIKKLVETGDVAKAQAVILEELSVEFGGSAQAAGQTFAGQLERLKNTFVDLQEIIGFAFLPLLQRLAEMLIEALSSPAVQNAISGLVGWITAAAEKVGMLVEAFMDAGLFSGEFAEALEGISPELAKIWDFLSPLIQDGLAWLRDNGETVKGALMGVAVGLGALLIVTTVATAISALNPIMLAIVAVLALLGAAWTNNWGGIRDKTAAVVDWLKTAFADVSSWLSVNIPVAVETVKTIWANTWAAIQAVVQTVLPIIRSIVTAFQAAFAGDWYAFGANLRAAWDNLWELLKTAAQNGWTALKGIFAQLIQSIQSAFANVNWAQVGKNIIEGIKNGIVNAAGALAQAALNAAKASLNAVKGFLGIKSPSKVFEGIGANMMTGWMRGIEALTPALATSGALAAQRTTQSIINNTYYNLSVNSLRSAEDIERDFWLMRRR